MLCLNNRRNARAVLVSWLVFVQADENHKNKCRCISLLRIQRLLFMVAGEWSKTQRKYQHLQKMQKYHHDVA